MYYMLQRSSIRPVVCSCSFRLDLSLKMKVVHSFYFFPFNNLPKEKALYIKAHKNSSVLTQKRLLRYFFLLLSTLRFTQRIRLLYKARIWKLKCFNSEETFKIFQNSSLTKGIPHVIFYSLNRKKRFSFFPLKFLLHTSDCI